MSRNALINRQRQTVRQRQVDSHCALFDHGADVVEVVSEATHRQTQHLNLRLCPFGPEDKHMLGSMQG